MEVRTTSLTLSMPDKITGYECDTEIENVRFHTMLTAGAFLPTPTLHPLPHNHPLFEGHLLLSGTAELVTPRGTFRLEKNDFCLLPPHIYHHAQEIEPPSSSIAFFFSFARLEEEERETADLYSALVEKLSEFSVPQVFKRSFSLAHSLFALTEEMGRGAVGKSNRLATRAADMVYSLLDLICPDLRGEYHEALSAATRQQLTIDSFFSRNYAKDVTLRDLSEIIFLSERQTARVLLDLYGLSFKQKLIETRVHSAMQFLITTDRPVNEIAEQSGYHSAVGFHTAFRQITGTTPAKYRAAARKNAAKAT